MTGHRTLISKGTNETVWSADCIACDWHEEYPKQGPALMAGLRHQDETEEK